MDFITDEELEGLSDEPAAAFVEASRIIRNALDHWLDEKQDHERGYRKYMAAILPTAEHLGIDLGNWSLPPSKGYEIHVYLKFMEDVEACTNKLRLTLVRRAKEYSVALDAATKLKVGHLLQEVRSIVEKLEVSVAKKDRLVKLLNAFQVEIDRERTTFQTFGALMVELCDDMGEAAERLEPVVRLVERIGAAIGVAKRAEDAQPRLPAPKPPKRIGGPKKKDDDIPF